MKPVTNLNYTSIFIRCPHSFSKPELFIASVLHYFCYVIKTSFFLNFYTYTDMVLDGNMRVTSSAQLGTMTKFKSPHFLCFYRKKTPFDLRNDTKKRVYKTFLNRLRVNKHHLFFSVISISFKYCILHDYN